MLIVLLASDIPSCLTGQFLNASGCPTGQLSTRLVVKPGGSPLPGCLTAQLSITRLSNRTALLASGCLTGQLSIARLPNWTALLASGCLPGSNVWPVVQLGNWLHNRLSSCIMGKLSIRMEHT